MGDRGSRVSLLTANSLACPHRLAQENTPLTRRQLAELMPSAQGLLSDEPEMEHSLHALQLLILVSCLNRPWQDRNDYFLAWNLTVYYSREQFKNKDLRGPDLFLVKGVENRPRPSWVVWEDHRAAFGIGSQGGSG
ncbi:hypothetical protein [Synechococcus sp. H70.1]|uniref:hypothetical protein n=1 Tax=Synechococcus sp. H70.1 TaxID=2964527 RepID=UPI0039C68219